MNKHSHSFIALSLLATSALAQVGSEQINVVQEYKPTIADAFKINSNPVLKDSTPPIPALSYPVVTRYIDKKLDLSTINPATMKGEPLTKLYRCYLKAGLGTYTSPYGELFVNNLRSKKYSVGAHLKHYSSAATLKDVGFAGFSDNDVNLYGKYFIPNHILTAEANYNRNVIHYYGFDGALFDTDSLKNLTKERYNNIEGKATIASTYKDSTAFNHDVAIAYYNYSDLGPATEDNVNVTAGLSRYLTRELLGIRLAYDYYNYSYTGNDTSAALILINPFVRFNGTKWQATMGINTTIEADKSKTHFLPNLTFKYNIVENIFAGYAELTGYTKRNSFRSLTMENPYIIHTLPLENTTTKADAKVGFRGSYSSKIAFNVFAAYSVNEQMPLFVNYASNILQNRFTVVYDDINIFNLHAEGAFMQKEKFTVSLKGDYFAYATTTQAKAWYKPELQFTLSGKYNLQDKVLLRLDVFNLSSQYAQVTELDAFTGAALLAQRKLKGVTDINLGAEYRYNKKLSAFLNLNNIGSMRYYRWYNYPSQKFSLMGGITFSF